MALEEFRLCLEKALNNVLHQPPCLILELVLRRAQDFLEDDDELRCQALDGGLIGLV